MATAITTRATIPLGIIFSTTGSYRTVGREMLDGALLALEEINASSEFDFKLASSFRDPAGELANYRMACEDLLRDRSVRHIVGCYTSSSRKEVIPAIEKYDALLWYPSHYEGFETCSSVVYTGASPNQHIVPLSEYMLGQFGLRVYCVGSNYIWAWENNRILREIVDACGGSIVAEKYHPVGSTEVGHFIEDVKATKPDFIFNTLIGESAYAFYRAYYESGLQLTNADAKHIPIASCSLSEPELLSIGGDAAAGHIASSVYFQANDRQRNHDFVTRFRARFGQTKVTSADAEASYIAVILLAHAIRESGSTAVEQIKKALYKCHVDAPQGSVWIDPQNNHSFLTPALGRSRSDGQFDIIWSSKKPVKPDPYLVWFDPQSVAKRLPILSGSRPRTHLKVVS